MIDPDLSCKEENRREAVRAATLFGLDYVEVSEEQDTLTVFFLGKMPPKIRKENVRISGGRRITGIQVTGLRLNRRKDPALDDSMDVSVDPPGDFSTYTLSVVQLDDRGVPTDQSMEGFDPRYSQVKFGFKDRCPTGLDCKTARVCPPEVRQQPDINYLAKDYQSFRQLILDRLALIMPNWQETHVPDIGVTLVELLAYVGDYLSYYQDSVATEAYLNTARQRISVRRHARLVDYSMHDGCNARAWLTLHTDRDQQLDAAAIYFITGFPDVPGFTLTPTDLEPVPVQSYEVFRPLVPDSGQFWIFAAHSEIGFYTWGDSLCCLARGATAATLVDQWVPVPPPKTQRGKNGSTDIYNQRSETVPPAAGGDGPPGTVRMLKLKVGDVLIFEERLGPKTGNPSDADPTHRQAVRLTKVTPAVDTLYHPTGTPPADTQYPPEGNQRYGQPVLEIEWAAEDSLTFPLCISSRNPAPDCSPMLNVSIALGNVILVDHGNDTTQTLGTVPTGTSQVNCPSLCCPPETQSTAGWFRPVLSQRPLTLSQPIPASACSAAEMIAQFPRKAIPRVTLSSIPAAPGCLPNEGPPTPCEMSPLFTFDDLSNPTALAKVLKEQADTNTQFLYSLLTESTQQKLAAYDGASPLPVSLRDALLTDLTAQLETWHAVRDLLKSGPDDESFVAEMDDDGYAHLRFGDDTLGRLPDAGMEFRAAYRTGNGTAGNVGAETITYMVMSQKLSGVDLRPRNPMSASGGLEPEPVADVKQFAPYAFRGVLERAITSNDYATLAANNERRMEERPAPPGGGCSPPFVKLQGAKSTLRWNGSWFEALVAVDPVSAETASPGLLREICGYLEPYRRMGQDLIVKGAEYVPLELVLAVCVLPDYQRGHVEAALLDVFSSSVLPDGSKGFFHPDNLTFGEGLAVSRIIAAAQAVPGVAGVALRRFERYKIGAKIAYLRVDVDPDDVPRFGFLTLGPFEIAQLDNDPSFPENGRLQLMLRGGR